MAYEPGEVPLEFRKKTEAVAYNSIQHFARNIDILYDDRLHPRIERARDMISNAERIFILGFGYAEENLKLLALPESIADIKEVYGTNYGIVPRRFNGIKRQYFPQQSGMGKRGVFEQFGCLKMLQEYY